MPALVFNVQVYNKPYLAQRITQKAFDRAIELLQQTAEVIPKISEVIASVSRDPKDDYLLAYALFGQADYLVTGDQDLLSIGSVAQLKIVTPTDFLEILRQLEKQS